MPRIQKIQNSLTGGEISNRMFGRTDLTQYGNSVETMENFAIWVEGGSFRRPGTKMVAAVKDASKKAILIPFKFNTEQAYMLEFGHLYMRVYKDRGQVFNASNAVYECVSPYSESDLPNIKYVQSADVMYFVDGKHIVWRLERTGHSAWSFASAEPNGPYMDQNDTDTTLTPSATSGNGISISASSNLFASTDVGRLVTIKHSNTWGYAKITAYGSPTSVTADVVKSFGAITGEKAWKLGAFYGENQPRAIGVFDSRLWLAGTKKKPNTLYGSKTNQWEDFSVSSPVVDTDALNLAINDGQVNAIRWLEMHKGALFAGVSDGNHRIYSSDKASSITSKTAVREKIQTEGSSTVQGRQIGDAIVFLQDGGRQILELAYEYTTDGWRSPNLNLLARHITKRYPITAMAYQRRPDGIVWFLREDGVLVGITYKREEKVVGVHRHIIGGCNAKVEAIATLPSPDNARDDLWMIVSRTIDGETKKYVEYLTSYEEFYDQEDCFYVDSGLTYEGTPKTVITGLEHLKGETVSILADGAVVPNQVVTSDGKITLPRAASKVHVGLPYVSKLKTLRIEAGQAAGTAQGKMKRIDTVILRVVDSLGGKVGTDKSQEQIVCRSTATPLGQAPALISDDVKVQFDGGWDDDGQVVIIQDQPLPMNITAIITRVNTSES